MSNIVTGKILVPNRLTPVLDAIYPIAKKCLGRMLRRRHENSTKFYKELPSVLAKGLIAKYQSNKKLRHVKSIVLPISGDKGKMVKWDGKTILVPVLFKKDGIEVVPTQRVARMRCVEFKRIDGQWWMFYSYDVESEKAELVHGAIGVDRNCLGNVVAMADTVTGKVKILGPDISSWKTNFNRRKRKLQKKGAYESLKKLKRKQSNRTRDINHKVSKGIVDFAALQRKPIVMEKLKLKKKGQFSRNARKKQWSFFQLEQFVKYKASLRGILVYFVSPFNTTKECSRCGKINNVEGKKYVCECGHHDHRDVNAAFNIGGRLFRNAKGFVDVSNSNRSTDNDRELSAGSIGSPSKLVKCV